MTKKDASRYKLELQHAPDVDPVWTEAFILEARLQDITGRGIGDALAEINSHVVESGQSPDEAFGDPRQYARTLAKDAPLVEPGGVIALVLPAILQTVGMLAVLNALLPATLGEPFELTVGMLAMMVTLTAALGVLSWQSVPIIRLIIDRPWLAFAINVLLLVGLVGLLFIPGVVASLPAWWVVGAGVVLLVVGTVYGLVHLPSVSEGDLIEAPTAIDVGKPQGLGRWASILPNLLIPAFTVVFGAVLLLFG